MVPVSEPPKKVVPVFERGKRSCQYLMITLKVVPLYDVNPLKNKWLTGVDPVSYLLDIHQGKAQEGKEQLVMMMMVISTFTSRDYVGDCFKEALDELGY